MAEQIDSFRQLRVYQEAFSVAQTIYDYSKSWPREERFALVDQVRRSSRSIGANIAEAWTKRRYPAHFISKLTDADAELQETSHWLDIAVSCGYFDKGSMEALRISLLQLGQMLGHMIKKSATFTPRAGQR